MSNSKNDIAWQKIFEKYKIEETILANGYYIISSSDINEFREARLMTKFDHKSQLPFLFIKNDFSILPISRGSYIIGPFESYFDFGKKEIEVVKISIPALLESLDYRNITSESTAINCAFVSRIIHDFTGEENLFPTVSGRMSSSIFEFDINKQGDRFKIAVDNSQIEIDGGYEGDNSLIIIEAKNDLSDDFLIRQLFYPFKLWNEKISKKVRPIFLTYSNGIFHLREYEFTEPKYYNSLKLLKEKKYSIQDRSINIEVIQSLLIDTLCIAEPHIPFPQANNFERVINLCELINQKGVLSKDEITRNYDFDSRQTDYYLNAGKYLGLLAIENGQSYLTGLGKRLFKLLIYDRQIEFIRLILSHVVFKGTLEEYFENGLVPSKDRIVEIMKTSKLFNIDSDITYYRRASTILGWINWIIRQIEE